MCPFSRPSGILGWEICFFILVGVQVVLRRFGHLSVLYRVIAAGCDVLVPVHVVVGANVSVDFDVAVGVSMSCAVFR